MPSVAQETAMAFLRPYVQRGDTLEALRRSHMAHVSHASWVQIGGYLVPGDPSTLHRPDKILVRRINGETVNQVFSLKVIYNALANEQAHPQITAQLGVPGNEAYTCPPGQALLCPECYDQAPAGPLETPLRLREGKDGR